MNQVINNDNIFKWSILDDSEVFDLEAIDSFKTIFPVKYPLNGFIFFVYVLYDRFSVVFGRGSEDIDLVVLGDVGKEL